MKVNKKVLLKMEELLQKKEVKEIQIKLTQKEVLFDDIKVSRKEIVPLVKTLMKDSKTHIKAAAIQLIPELEEYAAELKSDIIQTILHRLLNIQTSTDTNSGLPKKLILIDFHNKNSNDLAFLRFS